MNHIVYWNEKETTLFAVEELRRLLKNVHIDSTIHAADAGSVYEKAIHLITTEKYNASITRDEDKVTIKEDGFAIIRDSGTWIMGNEPRSILYGVYSYCQDVYGYQWVDLNRETIDDTMVIHHEKRYIHEPNFKRRGNVLETINDPEYINALIDWGVKNGHNEFFFTFFLWDEMKPYIYKALKKRDVRVTLGGHSLSYILEEIITHSSAKGLEQDEKLQFFAKDNLLQRKVIKNIVERCKNDSMVQRISLWPEDIGIDAKNANSFMTTYIQFTEKLKEALDNAHLPVETEHIVYNAELSWEMLERDKNTTVSSAANILYAFWGRDYSKNIHSDSQEQKRSLDALKDWSYQAKTVNTDVTVFEYYSDHFMLTELFPPLIYRIKEDLHNYKQLGISGMLNLIVPKHHKQIHKEIDEHYPWKWIHHLNNYIFARLAWGMEFDQIIESYFSFFKSEKSDFQKKMQQLEQLISQHTKWNFRLFPARIVDPEKRKNNTESNGIVNYLNHVYEFLDKLDLSEAEKLLPIQNSDNSASFTAKEMTLIYFFYLKKIAELNRNGWR